MIIFVVNCGSSSIKYQLLNMNGEQVLAKGLIERIGMEGSVLKHTPTGKYTVDISAEIPDHSVGIQMALDALTNEEYGVIDSMDEIDAVGHRVVHGGERFTDSVLISDDVLNGIEACAEIAPLHNPPNLYGIKACMRLMYNTPQVAVLIRRSIRLCQKLPICMGCLTKCMSNTDCAAMASMELPINM